jgi:DNA-binding GntR family transcriptional regulator
MLKHRDVFDADHRGILGALNARDAGEAVRLLDRHLTRAANLLAAELDRA